MKWKTMGLAVLTCLAAIPLAPADVFYNFVDRPQQQRQLYEEIEILRRLFDRGVSRLPLLAGDSVHMNQFPYNLTGITGSIAFDGKSGVVAGLPGGMGSVRLWDSSTGRSLGTFPSSQAHDWQGFYLPGQGVVYSVTLPQHGQPVVGGPAKPEPVPLSEWERVRKELRGEKVEAEKSRNQQNLSIADVVLKALAQNGHHLSQVPETEKITVAITLVQAPAQGKAPMTGGMMFGGGSAPMMSGFGAGNISGGAGYISSSGSSSSGLPSHFSSSSGGGSYSSSGGQSSGNSSGGMSSSIYGSSSGGMSSSIYGSSSTPAIGQRVNEVQKQILLGDLHMTQSQFQQALAAYQAAKEACRNDPANALSGRQWMDLDMKLVQVLFVLGKKEEAVKYLDDLISMVKSTAKPVGSGQSGNPSPGQIPLPDKLIISVPRKLLDQVGTGKMSFEDFRKAASVEYLSFRTPEPVGSSGGVKKPDVKKQQ